MRACGAVGEAVAAAMGKIVIAAVGVIPGWVGVWRGGSAGVSLDRERSRASGGMLQEKKPRSRTRRKIHLRKMVRWRIKPFEFSNEVFREFPSGVIL
jgi:hypothetical protein